MVVSRSVSLTIVALLLVSVVSVFADVVLEQDDCTRLNTQQFEGKLPQPKQNNTWYKCSNTDTVIVFVHGILGDSRDTWLNDDRNQKQYWPELIFNDLSFTDASIFLGGYYTSVDSGPYDIRHASDELFGALKRRIEPDKNAVIAKKNMLFVCHSTGGIVVRYMLYHNREVFKDKTIGLVLIASPSLGSRSANILEPLISIYNQKLGKQLTWNYPLLNDLDENFKNLVDRKVIPNLVGEEWLENHFIIQRQWWPFGQVVVGAESAARYFGAPKMLRDTDHFTTVKPPNRNHPAYQYLSDFFLQRFKPEVAEVHRKLRTSLLIDTACRDSAYANNPRFKDLCTNKRYEGDQGDPAMLGNEYVLGVR